MKNIKQKKIISEQIQLWSFFPQKPNISIDFMEQAGSEAPELRPEGESSWIRLPGRSTEVPDIYLC